jgi:hypothetical protein
MCVCVCVCVRERGERLLWWEEGILKWTCVGEGAPVSTWKTQVKVATDDVLSRLMMLCMNKHVGDISESSI